MSAESWASRFRVLLGVTSLLALASSQAQTPVAPAKPNAAPAPTAPFTDFRYEAPGNTRKITVADLPQPYATPVAGNGPKIVPRPPNVWPKALPGFKVDLYAEDVGQARLLRTAPNGDVFAAVTAAGKIVLLRGVDDQGKVRQASVFASGLNKPFGIAFYPPGPKPQWM